ncbi:MAG: PHP domain-containing protein [Limnochordia bacterium]
MSLIDRHLHLPSTLRTSWACSLLLCCLSLLLILFVPAATAGSSYLPLGENAADGRLLYFDEPSETVITVQTQFTFGEDAPDKLAGLWLAGLKETPAASATALALTWAPVPKGWLGEQWSLQLQSATGLIPTQLTPRPGVGFLADTLFTELVAATPKPAHTYEALLSYDPASGAVAVRLRDLTDGEVIAYTALQVHTSTGPLIPFAGALTLPDAAVMPCDQVVSLDTAASLSVFVPVGLSWHLVDTNAATVTLHRIDRRTEYALHLESPRRLPGQLYFLIKEADGTQRQLMASQDAVTVLPLSVADMAVGNLRIELVYEFQNQRWSLEEKSWSVGAIQATLAGVSLTEDHLNRYLTGNVILTADGLVKDGTLELSSTLVATSGVRSVTSLGTSAGASSPYTRLADGQSSVIGQMQCALSLPELGTHPVTIPFRCVLPAHFDLADNASDTWVSITAALLEPQDVRFSVHGSLHFPLGLSQTKRSVYRFPQVNDYQVMVGDFHIHTTRSDGKVDPKERLIEAYYDGYDVIAITDHRTMAGYDEMIDLARALGILLIRGIETGPQGEEHYVVFGIPADFVPRNPHSWASTEDESKSTGRVYYRDQLNYIKQAGGLVIYAHPHRGLREPTLWAIEQGILNGIEVYNGTVVGNPRWGAVATHGTEAYPFAFDWARQYNLAVFANSDIHEFSTGPEGRAKTLFLVTEPTEAGIIEAVLSRRTIAWIPQPAMLWAAEDLLKSFITSVVDVSISHTDTHYYKTCVQLENRGAFPVRAKVTANAELLGEVEIRQGEHYILWHWDNVAEIQIDWLNLWINPQENLRTIHVP